MNALPNPGIDIREYSQPILSPSYTYRVDLDNNRTAGYVDHEVALRQAIILALSTQKGKYEIYDEDYGIDLYQLIGVSPDLAKVRLPRLVKECLLADRRIDSVDVKDIVTIDNQLRCTVVCNGNIEVDMEYDLTP